VLVARGTVLSGRDQGMHHRLRWWGFVSLPCVVVVLAFVLQNVS
jgi:hypothetical protein